MDIVITLIIRLLVIFVLIQVLLFKVLLLSLSFLLLALHFYTQTNNLGLVVFAILLLFVTGVIILRLWIRSLILERSKERNFIPSRSKAYMLIGIILILILRREGTSQKEMIQVEAFTYLLESNYLGSIFMLFLLVLLLLSRIYLKLRYKRRSR